MGRSPRSTRRLSSVGGGLRDSSHVSIQADKEITIIGSVNSQFIHLLSNVSITVVGSLKSQRIDCISDEVFCESVQTGPKLHHSTTSSRKTGTSSSPVSSRTTSSCTPLLPLLPSIAPLLAVESKASIEGGSVFLAGRSTLINGRIDANGSVRLSLSFSSPRAVPADADSRLATPPSLRTAARAAEATEAAAARADTTKRAATAAGRTGIEAFRC